MYFVIRKNKNNNYWWRAVGDNNEIMAASELMSTKQSCTDAIKVIKAQASTGNVIDKTDEITERGNV